MFTTSKPTCLCGCVRSDEAVAARRERAEAALRERAVKQTAFDMYYDDLKAGRPLMEVADYLAIAAGGS